MTDIKPEEIVCRGTWEEFNAIGLIPIANDFFNAFGWALIFETDEATKTITGVYPAKVKMRDKEYRDGPCSQVTKIMREGQRYIQERQQEERNKQEASNKR